MIKILSDAAICMCPHGGQLKFMVMHMKADGMDGQALTMQDYTNAMIVGCAMPPPPAGVSPCLKVMLAIDPMGQAMKVNGNNVVTQMVVSFTDKGWPIMVVSPGMSAMSINIDPSLPSFRKAEFVQGSVQKQSGLGIGEGRQGSTNVKPFKDVIIAYWGSDYARRKETLKLRGRTIGFGDGTPATLLVYKYDLEGNHKFETRLTGAVKKDEVEVTWKFDYQEDVAKLPSKVEGAKHYSPPEYFFDLTVGGKSARSGLLEFRDWVEIELVDKEKQPVPAEFVAQFADGSTQTGVLDDKGGIKLLDVPPGKVFWSFGPIQKSIVSAVWSTSQAAFEETVMLKGKTKGFADGTSATFRIFKVTPNIAEKQVKELSGTLSKNVVETEWTVEEEKDSASEGAIPKKQSPRYVFDLIIEDQAARSEALEVKDKVVCVRLIGMFFDTNKNFLLPSAMVGMQTLVGVYEKHPDAEVLVVGHTDRSGEGSYNDALSLERAEAVAAYLTDDVAAWLKRYETSVPSQKRWGEIEDNHMLQALPDFATKPPTQSAVEWFQETRGLKVDNIAGPETRRQLITEYMAHDRTTLPQGVTMETHGCGENFPLDASGEIDTNTLDGERDSQDRRVEMFVFDPPGIRPKPPGKNSRKGSTEYPTWQRMAKETKDLKTGRTLSSLWIRLDLSSSEAANAHDRFRLFSKDGYDSTLTLSEAFVDGGESVDLEFKNTPVASRFSLEVHQHDGAEPYLVFEDVPYDDLHVTEENSETSEA